MTSCFPKQFYIPIQSKITISICFLLQEHVGPLKKKQSTASTSMTSKQSLRISRQILLVHRHHPHHAQTMISPTKTTNKDIDNDRSLQQVQDWQAKAKQQTRRTWRLQNLKLARWHLQEKRTTTATTRRISAGAVLMNACYADECCAHKCSASASAWKVHAMQLN